MSFINKILLFLIFLGLGIWIAGLLPNSMLEDSQEYMKNNSRGEKIRDQSRIKFLNESLPKYYPQLINYLKENKSEHLSWTDDSGKDKYVYLTFSHYQGLVVETELYLGASQNNTPILAQPLQVRMVDHNTDGKMDTIELIRSDGDSKIFQPPFDEIQKYMWDVSLAIAFRLSECCK